MVRSDGRILFFLENSLVNYFSSQNFFIIFVFFAVAFVVVVLCTSSRRLSETLNERSCIFVNVGLVDHVSSSAEGARRLWHQLDRLWYSSAAICTRDSARCKRFETSRR
ncbi:hypothetical protein GQ42DRAFT_17066 [Ramicandelaber brevisporus]|nr:hypothetical protein GQ42DRAFT_17066 [Ramicandelaber brevisporus]